MRRYTGQSLSISTPFPYRVPNAKRGPVGADGASLVESDRDVVLAAGVSGSESTRASSRSGTLSGGCCRSASMTSSLLPRARLNPCSTAEDSPRSVKRTCRFTLYPSPRRDSMTSLVASAELSSTIRTSVCRTASAGSDWKMRVTLVGRAQFAICQSAGRDRRRPSASPRLAARDTCLSMHDQRKPKTHRGPMLSASL